MVFSPCANFTGVKATFLFCWAYASATGCSSTTPSTFSFSKLLIRSGTFCREVNSAPVSSFFTNSSCVVCFCAPTAKPEKSAVVLNLFLSSLRTSTFCCTTKYGSEKSTSCKRSSVTAIPDITKSILPVFNAPNNASKPSSSTFSFTPISFAIFSAMDTSKPTILSLPSTFAWNS